MYPIHLFMFLFTVDMMARGLKEIFPESTVMEVGAKLKGTLKALPSNAHESKFHL